MGSTTIRDFDFAENEDPEKAIEELYLMSAYACFERGDYPRCDEVGMYHENDKKDILTAKKIYKNNCDDHNFARSCYNFGRTQFKTMKTREEFGISHQYFEKACKLGDKRSCFESGRMLLDKFHPNRKDPQTGEKALAYFEHACNKVFEKRSCHAASEFYRVGKMGTPIDTVKALKYAERGCLYGDGKCCINAHLMYKNGDGVAVNEEKAAKYMDLGIKQDISDMKLVKYVSEGYRRLWREHKQNRRKLQKEQTQNYISRWFSRFTGWW